MKSIRFAMTQIAPFLFEYFFVGMAVGILMHEAGYAPIWVVLSGVFIYAGSMQIVMVSLLTAGTPLPAVAIMTFFVNARHIFYGIGFIDEFRRIGQRKNSFWKYPYMALTMTDETYSALCAMECPHDMEQEQVEFYVLFLGHMAWIASCAIGALAGNLIPIDMTGIDFSATAFFTAVAVNQWRQFPSHIPAVAGLVSAVLFLAVVGADAFILPALAASMVVLMILKDRVTLRMGALAHE